jgi:hypothetical protein
MDCTHKWVPSPKKAGRKKALNSKEITAYQCGNCGVGYMTYDFAELCCKQKKCACGVEISKQQWRCDSCKAAANQLRWECAERRPAPKNGWLYSQNHGRYFEVLDDVEDWDLNLPPAEFARRYQVWLCKPCKPDAISLNQNFEEYCAEDEDLPNGWQQAEQAVNDWIANVPDANWTQHPSIIAWNGEFASQLPPLIVHPNGFTI